MKERPILFSAPMVRAILANTKTVTRRICKPRHDFIVEDGQPFFASYVYGEPKAPPVTCPYGEPGDRLWVRETHAFAPVVSNPDDWRDSPDDWCVVYRADGDERPWLSSHDEDAVEVKAPWRPSIFMPRWASRITLDVVSVRVERLHDITEEDAKAEGIRAPNDEGHCWPDGQARRAFADLWATINGAESWTANPWVWRVEFRRASAQ